MSRVLALVLLAGCSATSGGGVAPDHSALVAADAEAYRSFPDALDALATARLPTDDFGLIGRNRTWGAMYSPRFQLGAGAALRVALASGHPAPARRAFRAVEAGAEVVRADGSVPSRLPPEIGGTPSAADQASGAAFFLGDACLGLLALDASGTADAVASHDRREAVADALGRAVAWLLSQEGVLLGADRLAPNRLLFNARAFQACGALAEDSARAAAAEAAGRFIEAALALHRPDGVFVEGGGHDTSYQGVAVRVGEDVLLAEYPDADGRLRSALGAGAGWLAGRVDPNGVVDSSGNTRTCAGGETVFGEPKRIAIADVFAGLAYAGVRTGDDAVLDAAARVARWARENAGAGPCAP